MPRTPMRLAASLTGVIAAASLLTVGLTAPAHAVTAPSLSGVVSHLTIKNGAPDPTNNPMDTPTIVLYSLSGRWVNATVPAASGAYSFDGLTPGTYKLGLRFDARNLLQKQSVGKNDVSYFYSPSGPTASWSKASKITLRDGASTKINLKAVSGQRITGTLIGEWVNGPVLYISQASGTPGDAKYNDGSVLVKTGKFRRLSGNRLKFTFTTTSLLKGSYKIWSYTLGGKHYTTYFTGNNKKASPKASKAKVIKIKKTSGTVSIGTYKALG